jgi:HAD superfamily PSPase-like hydrolase
MKYRLIIFDIDGTIAKHISSWRYIHEKLGLWYELAYRYQEKFLAGKISYRKFCEFDAAHWKGLPERKIREIFKKVPYAKNAAQYIGKLKEMGFKLAAVSTGLQYIAGRIKKELKFDYVLSNRLISRKGVLTGKVKINITHGAKGKILGKILKRFRVKPQEVICVGDSSGDIPLTKHSGYSIAFNSSDETFSKMVNYNCKTKDFKEVFKKIVSISQTKNTSLSPSGRGSG